MKITKAKWINTFLIICAVSFIAKGIFDIIKTGTLSDVYLGSLTTLVIGIISAYTARKNTQEKVDSDKQFMKGWKNDKQD